MWTRKFIVPALIGAAAATSCASAPQPAAAEPQTVPAAIVTSTPSRSLTQAERFEAWKTDFTNRAAAKGYDRAYVAALLAPAKINKLALDRDKKQPEFSDPIWKYVDNAASPGRLSAGKQNFAANKAIFDDVDRRYRVAPHILAAIWGLETSYGRIMGDHDIVSALSTFAFEGRRRKFGEEQLFAVLDILRRGDVRQEQLTGSWASAMGMTQFIPTTFRDYAVDFDGDGNKDLWKSKRDALGSAGHYLSRFGWRRAEPVFSEVRLPKGFDYTVADGRKMSVNDWTGLGIAPIGGQRWSTDAGFLEAKLLVPAGAKGPKFLTFKNFDVIKKYNNSTSYALGITVLGEAIRGRKAITTDWPRGDKPVGRKDVIRLQKKLTVLGYDTKGFDGIIGPNSRAAIRGWQAANGLEADAYLEQGLFKKIMAARR